MNYYLLLLPSVHDVMKAEKILLNAGVNVNVIATPREISHNCGVVIRFESSNLHKLLALLEELPVEKKIFKKADDNVYVEVTQE
ncbi:MAG TPA: DUF3343 domain-containing protein [Spirochaetota bacterium]|nr:DUF3343 domain-containing protein [Spirochaetota bacterium]